MRLAANSAVYAVKVAFVLFVCVTVLAVNIFIEVPQ